MPADAEPSGRPRPPRRPRRGRDGAPANAGTPEDGRQAKPAPGGTGRGGGKPAAGERPKPGPGGNGRGRGTPAEGDHAKRTGGNARGRGGQGRGGGDRRRSGQRREQLVEARRARAPQITAASYPPELPVSERREELLEVLRANQVVVVAGETGSGKTTQIPKLLLELGRGIEGQIAHTQPRRIAARSVAERIASELGSELGSAVGYAVRFDDRSGEDTLVRLVTDGLLLAEIQHDPLLRRYDTIVVDEAHERSLNIDFLLGVLHQLLPKRPDLKLVITSATIDTQRFAEHFGSADGTPAPIVEVSGRTYPVEVRYRPPIDEDGNDIDEADAIAEAVDDLLTEGKGDVLVFLSGEREIRDATEMLSGRLGSRAELLPLYARLASAEQQRVFRRAPDGKPRVVLATNVAETSLTVPGIMSVVDAGFARISRYSSRLKVQRLPIEAVSQASANQRSGRCGRIAPGTAVRLYGEEDFNARPEFTDPEVLRTSLASVILRMAALGLGDVEQFPFIDPPDRRQVRDGLNLLHELAAIESASGELKLTDLGHRLARLPIDPRLGRMILEADKLDCASEVIAICAALSIQDPRERPEDKLAQAQQQHAVFADARSDFLTFLNLWQWIQTERRAQTNSAFRKACKARFLHVLRVREWQDLASQLRRSAKEVGIRLNEQPADPAEIHKALLSGLLSHLGLKDGDTREYLGARGSRFMIGRGSSLSRKQPTWVMAAELVETNRLWARTVAQVDPKDALALAEHLVRRTYEEPRWDRKRGEVVATERVSLYGLPIIPGRAVPYGSRGYEESRELFLQKALVEGDWDARHQFMAVNEQRIADVERIEERVRQRGLLVDDAVLRAFFDERVPKDVVSGAQFDRWWRRTRHSEPHLLEYPKDLLLNEAMLGDVDARDWPTLWRQGDLDLRLSYEYEPGTERDGVTVHVPLEALGQIRPDGFDWLVPGLREELVEGLLRTLPKEQRRALVPVPELAQQVVRAVKPRSGPIGEVVAAEVLRLRGVRLDPALLDPKGLPGHLQIRFRVESPEGKTLADDHDLDAVRKQLRPKLQARLTEQAAVVERSGLVDWPEIDSAGNLPKVVALPGTGQSVRAYPTLVDEYEAVGVRVVPTQEEQALQMHAGTRRLLLLQLPSPAKAVLKQLTSRQQLVLAGAPYAGGAPAVLDDAAACAVDALMADAGGAVFERAAYEALRTRVGAGLVERTVRVARDAAAALEAAGRAQDALDQLPVGGDLQEARDDIAHQLGLLIHEGFLAATGATHVHALQRYFDGMVQRLGRLPTQIPVDRDRMHAIHAMEDELAAAAEALGPNAPWPPHLTAAFWAIQELRLVQLAPGVRAEGGPSAKKVRRLITA
ncbi:MAG: ATP-dependent RNA helicase HrpA [Solirubrobacteraceae bacterium]|nr:ATP-dependent RNA helicase HrpA [Solirubrobacteraceae bacterium]